LKDGTFARSGLPIFSHGERKVIVFRTRDGRRAQGSDIRSVVRFMRQKPPNRRGAARGKNGAVAISASRSKDSPCEQKVRAKGLNAPAISVVGRVALGAALPSSRSIHPGTSDLLYGQGVVGADSAYRFIIPLR
jgi:hypothetical protein